MIEGSVVTQGQEEEAPIMRVGRGEPGARVFVWSVWLVMTLAAAGYVARYGVDLPTWDDYMLFDQVTGARPVTWEWLWEQHNEHRYALPKLIIVAAERLARNDVRAAMFLTVGFLSGLAAAWLWLAARLPGGLQPSDALFPLLLLHVGHGLNLVWSSMLTQVLPTVLGAGYLVLLGAEGRWPRLGVALLAGVGLGLLPLCGATGLMFVPAIVLWLAGWAIAEARGRKPRSVGRALLIGLAAIPGLILAVFYFRGFQRGQHPADPDWPLSNLRAGMQFLTSGLGLVTAQAWPWSGVATGLVLILTVFFLIRAWWLYTDERPRAFGLLAFLGAPLGLAAAVGWGRGWAGESAGFQERYITMAAPLWAWSAIVFRLYAPPALGRFLSYVLFMTLCVLLWPNTMAGIELARERYAQATALARDVRAGVPAFRIVRRYTPFLHPSQDEVARLLPRLRKARVGAFAGLRDSPRFERVAVPLEPTALEGATWAGTTVLVTDADPQVTFTLPSPRAVAGIEIRYSHTNRQGAPARFQLTWRRPGQRTYSAEQRYANWNLPTGSGLVTTVWVDDVVADFRIQPDVQPCEFRIEGIVLLVAEQAPAAPGPGGRRGGR
jgi:hypothetical protein